MTEIAPRIALPEPLADPAAVARTLGISREAVELLKASEFIDLHLDTFIWPRTIGYDMLRRHRLGFHQGMLLGQTDLPRLLEINLTGGLWSITTSPYRPAKWRRNAFFRNLEKLTATFGRVADRVAIVRDAAEYRKARADGKHGAWISIQGGNALDYDLDDFDRLPEGIVVRVTVVHLTNSSLGATSNPYGTRRSDRGLTALGREYVRKLNEKRIFVDLAHISPEGFWDAVEIHDRTLPLIVTHTGVKGVHDHWRNLDDRQIRAVADSGGVVGVMYQSSFLGPSIFRGRIDWIVDHLDHIVAVAGEDHAALGSDWDGTIIPPVEMRCCTEFPRLVQRMLDRGWSPERVRKVLGTNFLRSLELLRPGA